MTRPARPARAPRADGSDTRRRILEVAGTIYAEQGVARTTSKDICARAGVNLAAVNYHFGSKDALYGAVLVEAHSQLVALEDLQRIAIGPGSPRARLERVLRLLLDRVATGRQPWGLKVLVHEMLAPSAQVPVLIRRAVKPKARLLFALVGEVLGVPQDHPAVQRAMLSAVLHCVVLLVAPRALRRDVLPALAAAPEDVVGDLVAFAMAGLSALRRRHAPAMRAPVSDRAARPRRRP